MFALRPGRRADLAPIALGSHLDTQPTGGKFDGNLGVLGALEAMRTLVAAGYETNAPFVVVNWTNEEGARFAPAMLGSGVFAGVYSRAQADAIADIEGVRFGEALDGIGWRGEAKAGMALSAYLELHIEQGPILEAEDKTIGVVTGVQGVRWYEAGHHWPGKPRRHHADAAARRCDGGLRPAGAGGAEDRAGACADGGRHRRPRRGGAELAQRDPGRGAHDGRPAPPRRCDAGGDGSRDVRRHRPAWRRRRRWRSRPGSCTTSPRCASIPTAWRRCGRRPPALGHAHRDIISGAGHDAVHMSRMTPSAMIFVPCKDGLSHNEAESATLEHCAAGAQVLLEAALALDAKLGGR